MKFVVKIIFIIAIILNFVLGAIVFNQHTKLKDADRNYIRLQSDYYTLNETCSELRTKYYDAVEKLKK